MSNQSRTNNLIVPQANAALHQMKLEIANELGIPIPQDGYYGNYTSRDTGSIGGYMTKRLVQMAEQQLGSRSTR